MNIKKKIIIGLVIVVFSIVGYNIGSQKTRAYLDHITQVPVSYAGTQVTPPTSPFSNKKGEALDQEIMKQLIANKMQAIDISSHAMGSSNVYIKKIGKEIQKNEAVALISLKKIKVETTNTIKVPVVNTTPAVKK